MKNRMIWFGRYEGWLRWLCKGIQAGDAECIKKSAKLFDLMLPDECMVIPMPGHLGYATTMKDVCYELHKLNKHRRWLNCLCSNPHAPNYLQKKNGTPDPISMLVRFSYDDDIRGDKPKFIIDNVIASGVTASAALEAIPEAMVCAIAKA
jgi:hypothetical protein